MWELVANLFLTLDLPGADNLSLTARWNPVETLSECLSLAEDVSKELVNIESISCHLVGQQYKEK